MTPEQLSEAVRLAEQWRYSDRDELAKTSEAILHIVGKLSVEELTAFVDAPLPPGSTTSESDFVQAIRAHIGLKE